MSQTKRKQHVWVVRQTNRRWAVRIEGTPNPVSSYPTQYLAIAHGRAIAKVRRCELIIQNRGTKIRAKDSYGRDTFPPRG